MSFDTELGRALHEQTIDAPNIPPEALRDRAIQSAKRDSRMRFSVGACAAFVTIGATAVVWATVAGGQSSPPVVTAEHGAVPSVGGTSCVSVYSPAAIKDRDFAFEGTVTAIEPLVSNETPEPRFAEVTFSVGQDLSGSDLGQTVTVMMGAPLREVQANSEHAIASYHVGTRLLVSGERLQSGSRTLRAWGCGFTRYYDDDTAGQWGEQ